tara:strand:+ start:20 stop:181 length:162 start_codon:yes stop_codon:yes gene_type:complete
MGEARGERPVEDIRFHPGEFQQKVIKLERISELQNTLFARESSNKGEKRAEIA